MKVLAKVTTKTFLCEINEDEIERFLNSYYKNHEGMRVGEEINLAKGYNYMRETRQNLDLTKRFIESNGDIIKTIIEGVQILGVIDKEAEE